MTDDDVVRYVDAHMRCPKCNSPRTILQQPGDSAKDVLQCLRCEHTELVAEAWDRP